MIAPLRRLKINTPVRPRNKSPLPLLRRLGHRALPIVGGVHPRVRIRTVLLRPGDRIAPASRDVHRYSHRVSREKGIRAPSRANGARTEPDDEARREAQREQEREALPVVARVVDDRLDDVGPDHRRRAVRQPEQAEKL